MLQHEGISSNNLSHWFFPFLGLAFPLSILLYSVYSIHDYISLIFFMFSICFFFYLIYIITIFLIYSKIGFILLPTVEDISSCIFHQLARRTFFRHWKDLFVVFDSFPVPFEIPFFRQYLLIYFFKLFCQTWHYVPFLTVRLLHILTFSALLLVGAVSLFVLFPSLSSQVLYFGLDSFGGYQFYHWLFFLPNK